MATISASFYNPVKESMLSPTSQPTYNAIGSWGNGNYTFDWSTSTTNTVTTPGVSVVLYRGLSGGNYVYSYNTPPAGATDIVIMSITA